MAVLPFSDRLLFPPLPLPFPPKSLSPRELHARTPLYFSLSLSPPHYLPPCSCSAGTLDHDPASDGPNPTSSISATSTSRRAVRVAWEKLVRWSRSWRSRNKSDVLENTRKVVVLGGGSFGTAMAAHMARKKPEMEVSMLLRDDYLCQSINETHINSKYFAGHKLPENIVATTCAKDALASADFCFHAVPVQFVLP